MSEPFQKFGPADRDRIREYLVDLGLLEGAAARIDAGHDVISTRASLTAKQGNVG